MSKDITKSSTKIEANRPITKAAEKVTTGRICRNEYNATKLDNSLSDGRLKIGIPDRVPLSVAGNFPALINLDTLQFKISDGALPALPFTEDNKTIELPSGYVLDKLDGGGKQYAHRAGVYFRGERLGTLLWGARYGSLAGTAKYEIDNVQLYDTINMDVWQDTLIDNLLSALESAVIDVFRADIAIDSQGVMTFLQRVQRREITAVRQRALKKGKGYIDLVSGDLTGLSFGARTSGRYIRVYNKSEELREKHPDGQKEYIRQFWIVNDLVRGPMLPDVGRLEVQLGRKFLDTVKGFQWRNLFDRGKLVKLAEVAISGPPTKPGERPKSGFFDWVSTDHPDGKLNRRPRVPVVDFSQVKTEGYTRQRPEKNKGTRMSRIMIKKLILTAAIAADDAEAVNMLCTAAGMCIDTNLHDWLSHKSDNIHADIAREAMVSARPINPLIGSGNLFDTIRDVYGQYRPVDVETGVMP